MSGDLSATDAAFVELPLGNKAVLTASKFRNGAIRVHRGDCAREV
jgi:hypothetical protein